MKYTLIPLLALLCLGAEPRPTQNLTLEVITTESSPVWATSNVFITNVFTTNVTFYSTNWDFADSTNLPSLIIFHKEPIVTKSNSVWRITFKP